MKERNKALQRAFGGHVKRLREKKGLTKANVGKLASMTEKQISRVESGSCSPTISTVQRIGNALGKSLRQMFNFKLPIHK